GLLGLLRELALAHLRDRVLLLLFLAALGRLAGGLRRLGGREPRTGGHAVLAAGLRALGLAGLRRATRRTGDSARRIVGSIARALLRVAVVVRALVRAAIRRGVVRIVRRARSLGGLSRLLLARLGVGALLGFFGAGLFVLLGLRACHERSLQRIERPDTGRPRGRRTIPSCIGQSIVPENPRFQAPARGLTKPSRERPLLARARVAYPHGAPRPPPRAGDRL